MVQEWGWGVEEFQLDQAGQTNEENRPHAPLCGDKSNESGRVRVKCVGIHHLLAENAAEKVRESWEAARNVGEEEEALVPLREDEAEEWPYPSVRTPLAQKKLHQDQEGTKLEKDNTPFQRITQPQTTSLLIQHQTQVLQLTGPSPEVGAKEQNPPKYTFLMTTAL